MKTITALSALAFLSLAAPAFADDMQTNGVQQRTAPGGMNNAVSPADQRGAGGAVQEGRSSATDSNGDMVNNKAAPGGMNNGLSPSVQHSN